MRAYPKNGMVHKICLFVKTHSFVCVRMCAYLYIAHNVAIVVCWCRIQLSQEWQAFFCVRAWMHVCMIRNTAMVVCVQLLHNNSLLINHEHSLVYPGSFPRAWVRGYHE